MRRCSPGGLTDTKIHPLPKLPVLPPAGGSFKDPTFGSTIIRVTGPEHGSDCQVAYSYWPTFNSNSTLLYVRCDGKPRLFPFDPKTMKLGPSRAIEPAFASFEDAIWSGVSPTVLLGHMGMDLLAFDVTTGRTTTVAKLGERFPGAHHLKQMSRSTNDAAFAFTLQGPDPGYQVLGYGAVRLLDARAILDFRGPVDECQISKNGRFVTAQTGQSGAGAVEARVHNLITRKWVPLTDDAPDYAPSHGDVGISQLVGHDNWRNALTARSLASPHTHRILLQWSEWGGGYHTSMLADGDKYAFVSTYGFGGIYSNEIIAVPLAGGPPRRLAHHRSNVGGYEDQPHANVSRDGCYCAFTSNWGDSGRRDVFLLKV